MSNEKEIRAFDFEVRADRNEEHGAFVSGRPIVYDVETDRGWCREIIARGALDKTDLKDVRLLVNHNVDMIPLARSRNNNKNSTMQLEKDAGGLTMRADLDVENNADAAALYSATSRGDISGMSFMFIVESDEWTDLDSDYPTRRITSISKVFEVSAVTWPQYEQTSLEARGLSGALDSAKEKLESLKEKRAELRLAKEKAKLYMEVSR